MTERFGTICSFKLFWVWGLYAGGVVVLSQLAAAAHLPGIIAWAVAAALGAAVLFATEGL
ncbi:MAG TPA: hypothetical protein VK760_16105 [Candidatus Acidoferrales bacterium]|jgi:hypothetical protein|nr:hypothetical protein [Candidatus Acidoferrales bacterium]